MFAGQEVRGLCRLDERGPGIPLVDFLLADRSLDDVVRFGRGVLSERRQALLRTLRDVPDLAWFLLFHADGRWRELALDRIAELPSSAFRFLSIAVRLNDWVSQVRGAAVDCAQRLFPSTSPTVIAEAALILLLRRRDWSRWREEAVFLDEALTRPDVASHLARRLAVGRTGPLARILAEALRLDAMDSSLPALARTAIQPAVRAKALQCLIDGRAAWPDGYARQWINKPLGLSRRVAVTGKRDMPRIEPLDSLLRLGAADRSLMVRKVAASALIEHRAVAATMPEVVSRLAADESSAVRERIAFLLRATLKP